MKNKSIWETIKIKYENKQLPKNLTADILIIGGGITGLTAAYLFKDTNKKIVLIDKSNIGMGITSKTTAKITYLQETIYQTLQKNFDRKTAFEYYKSQKEAISIINQIIKENNISCDLEKVDSIIFTLEKNGIAKIKKEKKILKSFNIKVKNIINPNIKKGIKVTDTYIFHPLKYLNGIKKIIENKITIYENVLARNITKKENYHIETNKGTITAKTIIIACHYPFFIIPTIIPLKTYIQREYVNCAKTKKKINYTAISIDNTLHSIRQYKDYIIYGSNKHRLTTKTNYQKNYQKSILDFTNYFKKNPQYTWMNQDIMSNDNLPFIGQIDKNIYLATAYNAWGMTNGTIAAKTIYDLITKNNSPYRKIFNPKRTNTKLISNSFIGSFLYLQAYITSLFKKNNPYYIKRKSIIYGVYIENNKKHIIKLICPHMKCPLVFNKEEKTWDCPCHGSRFDIDGNIIEGPATKNIKKVNKNNNNEAL